MDSRIVFAYITASGTEEAEKIGAQLVEERLAACINVIGGMRSVYRWQGRIEKGKEAILIAKTRTELFAKLSERVKALHSYACPCIIEIPLGRVEERYAEWLLGEVGER